MTTPYVSLDEFKRWVRGAHPNVAVDDVEFGLALDSATQEIRGHCGRDFNRDTSASARSFHCTNPLVARVDDFHTTTGLIVKTDDDDDGTFETTWTITTDFVLEPTDGRVDGLDGFPYWRIVAVGSRSFPTSGRRPRLQVTAQWGWAAIPDPVRRSTFVVGHAAYEDRNAPAGMGPEEPFGAIRVPWDKLRMVRAALEPYVRTDRAKGFGIG